MHCMCKPYFMVLAHAHGKAHFAIMRLLHLLSCTTPAMTCAAALLQLSEGCSMNRYITYSTLSKIGYIVRRCAAGHLMIAMALAAPASTATRYFQSTSHH